MCVGPGDSKEDCFLYMLLKGARKYWYHLTTNKIISPTLHGNKKCKIDMRSEAWFNNWKTYGDGVACPTQHDGLFLCSSHDCLCTLPCTHKWVVFGKWGCIISRYESPVNNNKHGHCNGEKVGEG